VLVDPKGSDFARYAGADLVKPNRAEFEAVAGRATSDADRAERAQAMCGRFGFGHVLVTRGEDGMLLAGADGTCVDIPAEAVTLIDVTGAGDAALAGLAVGMARGLGLPEAARLANRVAAVAVSRPGTVVVDANEAGLGPSEAGDEAALARIARLRAAGERIVMTNGCFDLLHAGHLECLNRARALGDRLVVAVNDDLSVSRLKGPGRPVVPLDQRVALLRALRFVDFVLVFEEDGPEALIRAVSPHVLVKGGDYSPDAIAGADHVRATGGKVVLVPRIEGLSTTELCVRAASTAAATVTGWRR
jgi:D-beta-D-heptose 7-phosphate kinase/D-beta-D-heptose 1-phosphate adenosyltransferase